MAMNSAAVNRWFCSAVVKHAWLIIVATAILTIASLFLIVDVRTGKPLVSLDPSVDSILPTVSEDRQYFEHVKQIFDSGGTVIVALNDEKDIFTPDNLEKIKLISKEIEGLDKVNRVSSLSTALNIRSDGEELLVEPFYRQPPEDATELEDLKKRALSDPIYAGNLVSRDGKITVIVVHLLDIAEKQLLDEKIDDRIIAVANKYWPQNDVWVTGSAHIKAQMSEVMLRDLMLVVPVAMLVMAIVCFISYRSVRGVLVPLVVVGISVIITMAFVAVVFKTLNQVSIACPSMIVVVGYPYAIHLLSIYYDSLRLGVVPKGENPTLHVLQDIIVPVFYTGVTTAIGFISLCTSSLSAIVQFGISTGFGVCVTLLISITLAPALLHLLPLPKKVPEVSENVWADRFFEKIARFDIKHAKVIYAINIVIAIICLAAITQIKIGTDLVSSFKISSDVRKDFDAVNEHLEGANSFDIVMETDVEAGFQDPANLKVIEALQAWLKTQPQVGGSTSLVDYIKVINKGFNGDENSFVIPDDKTTVGQLLEIAGNAELPDYVNSDYQQARIVVRTTAINSTAVSALTDSVENYMAEHVPQSLAPRVTGNSYLVAQTMDDIAIGQVSSDASAFIMIFLLLAMVFKSFKAGFITMLPNVMPVLIFFGILGYTGISLNVSTSLIACIVLGIAVDDTIHIFSQFNKLAKQHICVDTGIVMAMKAVGRPVTWSTVALCAGFMCLGLSEMRTQIEFGLLTAVTLAFGWVSDITLSPAIAGRMKISECGTYWE
ncbi:MAG TPA: efflux RND transporter permease subunit [Pseudomonadales bacterium]|nr:efflux RND transporter permease subunit [Pseudomonadales bacterium]